MFPLSPHMYFELAALVISLVFARRLAKSNFFWLPFFLGLIVLVELAGRYMNRVLHVNNAWMYNLTVPIEYLAYCWLFYLHFTRKALKTISLLFMMGLVIYSVVMLTIVGNLYVFNFDMVKIGSSCIVILSLLFFVDLIKSDTEINLLKDPVFWFVTGLFLFNTGEFIYSLFTDYINQYSDRTVITIFVAINNKLIWVLYSCIIISILCISRRYRKA